jgi:hypothetical protein
MLKSLFLFTPCAIAGYLAYPYINGEGASALPIPQFNLVLLNSVEDREVIGAWALSPKSTGKLSRVRGTSGRRLGLSLESWGGGHANFVIGERHIDGPISWEIKSGVGKNPAQLIVRASDDRFVLKFSNLEDDLTLVAEADSVMPGEVDHIRFLKAS